MIEHHVVGYYRMPWLSLRAPDGSLTAFGGAHSKKIPGRANALSSLTVHDPISTLIRASLLRFGGTAS